ncbi:hypothetical protein ACROYT_G028724 [Oculina patagonica]
MESSFTGSPIVAPVVGKCLSKIQMFRVNGNITSMTISHIQLLNYLMELQGELMAFQSMLVSTQEKRTF